MSRFGRCGPLLCVAVVGLGCASSDANTGLATDSGTSRGDGRTTVADGRAAIDAQADPDGDLLVDGNMTSDTSMTADGGKSLDGPGPTPDTRLPSDGGTSDGGTPATFRLFNQIPQFGIYVATEPNYTPPVGVLMWKRGTEYVTKLSPTQQSQIGSDLKARVTYHAQCDNYDRLGGLFFIVLPNGATPTPTDQRIELARFITPFSDYRLGARATYVFPMADISSFAQALADPSHDVWVGIAGGSNPYDGDPCTVTGQPADFKAVGFKYSLDFVSTKPLASSTSTILTALYYVQATAVPVAGTFTNPGGTITGRVTVIVTGHGSAAGGHEYRNTQNTVTLNGKSIGSFNTKVDCAAYASSSPDGNPGIFANNNTTNPRNWCPGELVPPRSFPATLNAGSNSVSLTFTPSTIPSGSYYPVSISFSSP